MSTGHVKGTCKSSGQGVNNERARRGWSFINDKINKKAGAIFIHFIIVSLKPSTESNTQ